MTGDFFIRSVETIMKKYMIIGAVLAVAAVLIAFFFFRGGKKPVYRTLRLDRGDVVAQISATGTVNPVTTVQVGSQVSGTITKRYVDFDSRVRKGQIIAELDPALFQAQVEQARGNYLSAQASLHKAQVAYADAKRTRDRNQQLLKQGVVAQSDFDAAQTAYDSAEAGVRVASAGVVQMKGVLSQAETNRKNAVIRSPVTGVVISRNIDVGQTVAASFQTPTLFTIAEDLTKMQIETSVDEADISKARLGQRTSFTVDAYPDRQFAGTVTQIRSAPVTVQNVVTYIVVVLVDNKELLLKPGMTANVSIETGRRERVVRMPAAAVRFRPKADGVRSPKSKMGAGTVGGGRPVQAAVQTVYILDAGKPKAVTFSAGLSDSRYIEVLEGSAVSEGSEVVIEAVDATKGKKDSSMTPPMGPRM